MRESSLYRIQDNHVSMVALYTTKYYSSIFKKKKKIIQVVHCGLLHQGIFCLFKENYKKKDNHVHMLF